MSCSTRWRHPVGLPRAEPMQSRAQVLWPRPQWGNLLGQEWLRLQPGVPSVSNIFFSFEVVIFKQFFNSTAAVLVKLLTLQFQFCNCLVLWASRFWRLKALSLLSVAWLFWGLRKWIWGQSQWHNESPIVWRVVLKVANVSTFTFTLHLSQYIRLGSLIANQ